MFNFPWSNFHELNLDWILSVVKEAKEIFVKGEGDIQHAVETADQALETAEQAASGVIADGAVTIPKINGDVFSLFAYCVSGSVAPNFIPAGALVILRKSTIYNVSDGIYTATRNIPQAAIITAADLDQSATLYREGGMNYLFHNEEKLSGTIDLIKAGLVILVTGDEASAAVPADGLVYVVNNTHGLTEGFYFNSSGAEFPTTGGTADSDSFTAVNNILNALQTAISTLGGDLASVQNTLTKLIPVLTGSINDLGYTLNVGDYFESGGVTYKVVTAIPNAETWAGKAYALTPAVVNDIMDYINTVNTGSIQAASGVSLDATTYVKSCGVMKYLMLSANISGVPADTAVGIGVISEGYRPESNYSGTGIIMNGPANEIFPVYVTINTSGVVTAYVDSVPTSPVSYFQINAIYN